MQYPVNWLFRSGGSACLVFRDHSQSQTTGRKHCQEFHSPDNRPLTGEGWQAPYCRAPLLIYFYRTPYATAADGGDHCQWYLLNNVRYLSLAAGAGNPPSEKCG